MDADWTTIAVAFLGTAGTLTGYWVARRNSRDETERLRVQYREDERRNRQNHYHQMLAYFDSLDSWARSGTARGKEFEELGRHFDNLHGGMLLFGDEKVVDALGPVIELLDEIGDGEGSGDEVARWKEAYFSRREALVGHQGDLALLMRNDLSRALPR